MKKDAFVWILGMVVGIVGVRVLFLFMKHDGEIHFTNLSQAMASTYVESSILANERIGFAVNNKSRFGFSDLNIECDFLGESGSVIGSESFTLFEEFLSNEKSNNIIVRQGIPDQSVKIVCEAKKADLKTERLCSVVISGESKGEMTCKEKIL